MMLHKTQDESAPVEQYSAMMAIQIDLNGHTLIRGGCAGAGLAVKVRGRGARGGGAGGGCGGGGGRSAGRRLYLAAPGARASLLL